MNSSSWHTLSPWALAVGLLLDVLLGDPHWLPHPVRWIGALASAAEKYFRRITSEIAAGALFWLFITGSTTAITLLALKISYHIHPILHLLTQTWLVYQGVALRDLDRAVRFVALALPNDLSRARHAVSQIVSRDTATMDTSAICRAAIESAAENTVDGFFSPLFWGVLLGPAGLWFFKATSTLDSMVGYRIPRYERFGKVSARADDCLNWIPARLSFLFFALGAIPDIAAARRCLSIGWRDRKKHSSPNSGHPEALIAGYLGVRLGGPAVYHGQIKNKPWFGEEFRDARPEDLFKTLRLVWKSAAYAAAGAGLVLFFLY